MENLFQEKSKCKQMCYDVSKLSSLMFFLPGKPNFLNSNFLQPSVFPVSFL